MSSTDNHHGASGGEPVGPVEQVARALGELEAVDLASLDAASVADVLRDVELLQRQIGAVAASLLTQVRRGDLHAADGHASPRTMLRHLLALSPAEAAARDRVAAALDDLPLTAAAYREGSVGACQVRRLARTYANPRVRDLLPEAETHLLDIARSEPYKWFDDAVTTWERLADQDGTIEHERQRETARVRRTPSGMVEVFARLRSGRGAVVEEVFAHFLDAEVAADWDAARQEHGATACWDDLARTDAERSVDAFMSLVLDAASAPPGSREPKITIDLVIDHAEYLRQVAILDGAAPPLPAPTVDGLRSHSAGGLPVDPWDIAAATIGADLRRVVLGADRSVIDLGRRSRCFTGSARDAVMLRHPECAWAGCHTSTRRCQADHVDPHSTGGSTDASNGQPLCGRHNRHKHSSRYRVWCDWSGAWHTQRPDGSQV